MPHFEIDVDTVQHETTTADAKPTTAEQQTTTSETATKGPAAAHHGEHGEEEDDDILHWGLTSLEAPIFMMSLPTAEAFLQTSVNFKVPKSSAGLTQAEADKRLARDGPNELTPPPEESELLKYCMKYLDPFMILLWGAGILSFIAYGADSSETSNLWVAIVLFAATIISSTFTYIQEGRASAVMKSFKNLLPRHAHVIRDGRLQDILARDLVVGDVVVVGTGDQVPADMRVVFTMEMKVEKSSLTGESMPVPVSLKAAPDDKIEEAPNVVFNTTKCTEGECIGIVYAIGDNSIIGKIASLASSTDNEPTPIQKEVKIFVVRLAIFAFILGIIFLIIGLVRGRGVIDAIINCLIIVLIACVPEGLPLTVVSCLTITAKRMAKHNVFIKQLRSVETLGSASVIASDKTGTLTMNKMTVSHLWFDYHPFSAPSITSDYAIISPHYSFNSIDESRRRHFSLAHSPTLNALEVVATCCNRARFEDEKMLDDAEAEVRETYQEFQGYHAIKAQRARIAALKRNLPQKQSSTLRRFKSIAEDETRAVIGDGSDMALFNFMRSRQQIEVMRFHNRVVFELPFNSRNKFALCVVAPHEKFYSRVTINTDSHSTTDLNAELGEESTPKPRPNHRLRCISLGAKEHEQATAERPYGRRVVVMKGAPEVVVARCSHYMMRGLRHPIDEQFREEFQAVYESFGSQGERVLGFAWKELDVAHYPPEMDHQYSWEKLTFLGLISLVDPPKATVPKAIKECRDAGVRVIMVTGDHEITAEAIARQVGIITKPAMRQINIDAPSTTGSSTNSLDEDKSEAIVIHGRTIPQMTETDWNHALSKPEVVFARTTPEQKLLIVTHLQRLGHIVAVTGDGVNDSPALKKADIGLAMGIVGSDVARDAADVILMDDEFASVVHGIRYGRAIFDNLSKTIAYTVTHLAPEAIPVLLSIAFDYPPALTSLAILTIDLGSELAPAVSFAYEPPEGDVMSRPPRNAKTDHLFTWKMVIYCMFFAGAIETGFGMMAYVLVFSYYGISNSMLPFSSDYFTNGSPNLYLSGPAGCAASNATIAGCNFLTGSQQTDIAEKAGAAYWWMLVMSQVFHIWMCKTRYASVMSHGLFNNVVMWYGVGIEVVLILFFIFTPALNEVLVGLPFPSQYWVLFLVPWAALLIFNEGRKYLGRRDPHGWVAQYINW